MSTACEPHTHGHAVEELIQGVDAEEEARVTDRSHEECSQGKERESHVPLGPQALRSAILTGFIPPLRHRAIIVQPYRERHAHRGDGVAAWVAVLVQAFEGLDLRTDPVRSSLVISHLEHR